MKKYLDYNGYLAWYEWIDEDKEFHGRILGVDAIIGLYGTTEDEIKEDFKNAVKDYEEDFKEKGVIPINRVKEAITL